MSGPAAPFAWTEILRFGVLVLRLPPEAVWNLSVTELLALLPDSSWPRLDRPALLALIERFPDERTS